MKIVDFQCPRCRAHLAVAEAVAGEEVRCPSCTRPVQVPGGEGEGAAAAAAAD